MSGSRPRAAAWITRSCFDAGKSIALQIVHSKRGVVLSDVSATAVRGRPVPSSMSVQRRQRCVASRAVVDEHRASLHPYGVEQRSRVALAEQEAIIAEAGFPGLILTRWVAPR